MGDSPPNPLLGTLSPDPILWKFDFDRRNMVCADLGYKKRPKETLHSFETNKIIVMSAVPLKLRFSAPLRLYQAVCIYAAFTERFYLRGALVSDITNRALFPAPALSSFRLRSYRPIGNHSMARTAVDFHRLRHFSENISEDSLRHRLYFLIIPYFSPFVKGKFLIFSTITHFLTAFSVHSAYCKPTL